MTYKRPKTTKTRSKTTLSNVGFSTHIGVTDTSVAGTTKYYARVANINGISRNLSLVGDNGVAAKLDNYRSKLETYKNMKTIDENDTVGIIICKQDNEYVIKYCSDDRIIAREYELV